ncbi:MAG: type I-U CRISPR-associated protein Csb2 [Gemmatimonadales bacterium]
MARGGGAAPKQSPDAGRSRRAGARDRRLRDQLLNVTPRTYLRRMTTLARDPVSPAAATGLHGPPAVFRLESTEGGRLGLEQTARVLGVWRRALMARSVQPVPEVISGHPADSSRAAPRPSHRAHLALLPWAGRDGTGALRLAGVAACLPSGAAGLDRRAALSALGSIRRLTLGDLGVWQVAPWESERQIADPDGMTWRGPSRVWTSLTPVVFGRYPRDPWGPEAARVVAEACRIEGLPEPARVETARRSWIRGVPSSDEFPPLWDRPGRPRAFHVHVRLEFPVPVEGPVLVGAGRHGGYGVGVPFTSPNT